VVSEQKCKHWGTRCSLCVPRAEEDNPQTTLGIQTGFWAVWQMSPTRARPAESPRQLHPSPPDFVNGLILKMDMAEKIA